MRESIDFGIDLGTTNSTIAVVDDGEVHVIKNNDGWDYTPSAVWLPKPNVIHVGRGARERAESDPDNAAAEFKLEMGLAGAGRAFANAGVKLSPEQLSAEVLRSLRADAIHHYCEPPEVAVITVPAAFTLNQNNATSEAAKLAGFTGACPLVQEPTAAAFAYGFQDQSDTAYWMVFDLGGGTFDAAIITKRDGELTVLNHSGDSYLGGKLIDWAITERLLAPAAGRELGLTHFTRNNRAWRVQFAKLKYAAEIAKIHLSRRDTAEIMIDIADDRGTPHTFEYTLTRAELQQLAEPLYVRAINLCRSALAERNLGPDDIDRLLLVGSATLAPGLRELLADPRHGLGIPLDYSQDPSTAVARGAAIFASGLPVPRVAAPPKAGEFTIRLVYDPVVTTTTPTVAGQLTSGSPVDWTGYSVVLANPDGLPPFRSARIGLSAEGSFVAEVSVAEHAKSRFTLELADGSGGRQRLTPETFAITHSPGPEFGGAVLTHSVGIAKADGTFTPIVTKGTSLPVANTATFQTTIAVLRSEPNSVIRIPVVEGEWERADRNLQVGVLEIRPKDVRIDLPAGSDVDVTVEIDGSRLVTVVADVPLVQALFEAEIDLSNVQAPAPDQLRRQLTQVEKRYERLRQSAGASGSPTAQELIRKLDDEDLLPTVRELVVAADVDAAAASTAEQRLRDAEAQLDAVERAGQIPGLIRDLEVALDDCEEHVTASGNADDRVALAEMRRRARTAMDQQDEKAIQKLLEQAGDLIHRFVRRREDYDLQLFYLLVSMRDDMEPAARVDALIREGEQAIADDNRYELSGVCERLRRCIPRGKELGGLKNRDGGWR
ncbi:MAG: 2-alkenal reductase [Pseudonocardiales bacterium]|nr:MAG: 2-alkenal reductase [Pseudonocardiales bacterium]